MDRLQLEVPGSTANLGPGFDALALALTNKLRVEVAVERVAESSSAPSTADLRLRYVGREGEQVSLVPEENLITRTMLHVLNRRSQRVPLGVIELTIRNEIPLGKGMGSSGAAVVAGVMLADRIGRLSLSPSQMLDAALEIETHPDNISASLYGGFVVSCVEPVTGRCSALQTPVSDLLRLLVVTPDIELPTKTARDVLPNSYSRADVVFNLQRAARLTALLSQSERVLKEPSQRALFQEAVQDRVHQPYRQSLIPGLTGVLALGTSTARRVPGLLGICLSGAGPSVLAFVEAGHELAIGELIRAEFARASVQATVHQMRVSNEGARWLQEPHQ